MEVLMKLKCPPPTCRRSPHSYKANDRLAATPTACLDCCNGTTHTHTDIYTNNPRFCSTNNSCCAAPFPACCNSTVDSLSYTPQQNYSEETEGHYEYQEPEENFVSIDDAKIKGFLMKIGQEQREQKINEPKMSPKSSPKTKQDEDVGEPQLVYEIIDLDDEEEREKLKRIKNQSDNNQTICRLKESSKEDKNSRPEQQNTKTKTKTRTSKINQRKNTSIRKSPDISLVPKETAGSSDQHHNINTKETTQEPLRIVAHIELLDSSSSDESDTEQHKNNRELYQNKNHNENIVDDNDEDDDDDDIALAASAVSCELECDDQEDNNNYTQNRDNDDDGIVVLGSDEEYVDEHEEGRVVHWDELAFDLCYNKNNRNVYECYICNKKVQSNYNLRRHMMIHTGERPFGCDLCFRRFREFSDLKKHRRRHSKQSNFVCMVCRIKKPLETDPTRCSDCDSKNGALIALRTQTNANKNKNMNNIYNNINNNHNNNSQNASPTMETLTMPTKITKNLTPPPPLITSITVAKSSSIPNKKTTTVQSRVVKNSSATSSPIPLNTSTPEISVQPSFEMQLNLLDTVPPVQRTIFTKDMGYITRKEFPCPLCQRPFGTRHNLKRHFMIHTGEKPYNCTRCRKPFREYSTLKKHMSTHARERWYKCARCPQKFLDYLEYGNHKKTHPEDMFNLMNDGSASGNEDLSASSPTASLNSSSKKRSHHAHSSFHTENSYDSQDDDISSIIEDWLECCECNQRFTDFEKYSTHLKTHQNNDGEEEEQQQQEQQDLLEECSNESNLIIVPVGNKKKIRKTRR